MATDEYDVLIVYKKTGGQLLVADELRSHLSQYGDIFRLTAEKDKKGKTRQYFYATFIGPETATDSVTPKLHKIISNGGIEKEVNNDNFIYFAFLIMLSIFIIIF